MLYVEAALFCVKQQCRQENMQLRFRNKKHVEFENANYL